MKSTIGFFIAILVLTSCTKEKISGAGPLASDQRSPGAFPGISFEGKGELTINNSTQPEVIISGYRNILPYIETTVGIDGILHIRPRSGFVLTNTQLKVTVSMSVLNKLELSGETEATVADPFQGDILELNASGKSNIFWPAASFYKTVKVSSSGESIIKGFPLVCDSLLLTASGNTASEFTVNEHIRGEISGQGILYYKGNPTTDVTITGSASIQKK